MQTLASLRDRDNPMEPDRARAVAQVASVLVDTAKVEVDYLKAVPDYVRACVAVHAELLAECKATLQELGHLADGDQCTLIRLKRAVEKATGEKL